MRQGEKTSELQELLAETRKRLREGSSRSGMTAQDLTGLENQIVELEKTVAGLTKQIDEKGVAYIKKDSMFTRQAMSQLVFRKVEDVTTISKSQSLTSMSIKDCTLRVPNKTTILFLY